MSAPNIPDHYTINTTVSGGLDTSIAITELPTITTSSDFKGSVTSDSSFNGSLTSDSGISIKQIPEIKLGITQLPQIDMQIGIRPTRIHFPMTMKFTVCVLSLEVPSFSTCGESMVIIEDYHPNARERCQ